MKLLSKITYLFVDATFKTSPRGYYHTLNIMGFVEDAKIPVPLFIFL